MSDDAVTEALYESAIEDMRAEDPDLSAIVTKLRTCIAAGSPCAAYALATWYLHGKDDLIPQSYAEAIPLLTMAAEFHHTDALFDLAVCYSNGEGVEKSPERAFELYLQAALHADADAVFKVGTSYFYGYGVAQDHRVAEIWLDRSRELGTYEGEPDEFHEPSHGDQS